MKTQLRKLHLLFKFTILDPEDFYSISFSIAGGINLQGHYTSKVVQKYRKYFTTIVDESGYINMTRGNINIVLT